jgi:hypothetical protein
VVGETTTLVGVRAGAEVDVAVLTSGASSETVPAALRVGADARQAGRKSTADKRMRSCTVLQQIATPPA